MGRALELIKKLNAVRFEWKHSGEEDIGLIAEDVAKVIPEAVFYNEKGEIDGIRILPIIAIMIEAIKELGGNNGR